MENVVKSNININFNKTNARNLELEKLGDETMDTFSKLVGNALYKQSQKGIYRTNNNVPFDSGRTWYTCKRDIPYLIKILKENPNYFRDLNIVAVRILSEEDMDRRIRKNEHVDEMSFDYMHSKIPRLQEILDEHANDNMIYRNEKTGEIMTAQQVKKKERLL